jgi:hypothetical protein
MNVTTRELANLVPPGGEVARRLDLESPASGDRVLHLVPTPLTNCRLCLDGIATPAVGADVLAAPRLAREQREKARVERENARAATAARLSVRLSDFEMHSPPRAEHRFAPIDPVDLGPTATTVRAAIEAAGEVTSVAALVRELQIEDDRGEERLKSELYNLRIERVIDFDRPLGRSSAIRSLGKGLPGPGDRTAT